MLFILLHFCVSCLSLYLSHLSNVFCLFLQIIDQEINPYVDKWEEEGQFPAHRVFKILGNAGFLGVNKPVGEQQTCRLSAALVKLLLIILIFS